MPCHTRDVVVEIVADDHHNIGLSPLIENRLGKPGRWDKGCNTSYHQALQKVTARFHITFTRPTKKLVLTHDIGKE
jgi:hypothetical protein